MLLNDELKLLIFFGCWQTTCIHDLYDAGHSDHIEITQRELAARVGVSQAVVANIGITIDIDDKQHYLINTRYCNVRIESILLEVNEK